MEAMLKMLGFDPAQIRAQMDAGVKQANEIVAGIHFKLDKITQDIAKIKGAMELKDGE